MKAKIYSNTRMLLSVLLIMVGLAPLKAAVVTIDETTFPDEAFRYFVRYELYGKLSQAERTSLFPDGNPFQHGSADQTEFDKVTHIYLDNLQEMGKTVKISDLTGIKYFTNLEKLVVDEHNLTTLDLSGMASLKQLEAHHNQLTHLDIRGCRLLHSINIMDNRFTWRELSYIINNLPVEPEHGVGARGTLRAYDNTAGVTENNELTETHVHNARNFKHWDVYHGKKISGTYNYTVCAVRSEHSIVNNITESGIDDFIIQDRIAFEREFPDPNFRDFISKRFYNTDNKIINSYDNTNSRVSIKALIDQAVADGWYDNHGKVTIDPTTGAISVPTQGGNAFFQPAYLSWDDIYYVQALNFSMGTESISNLKGIELFTNLISCVCYLKTTYNNKYNNSHTFTTLDLSNKPNLQYVQVSGLSSLATVNLNNCPNLIRIDLSDNAISSFSINALDKHIWRIDLNGNRMTEESLCALCELLPAYGTIYDEMFTGLVYVGSQTPSITALNETYLYEAKRKGWKISLDQDGNTRLRSKEDTNVIDLKQMDPWLMNYIQKEAYSVNNEIFKHYENNGYYSNPRGTGRNPFYIDENTYRTTMRPIEARLILKIDLSGYPAQDRIVKSLDGIRNFKYLEQLNVNGHEIGSIDVSNMKYLRILRCHEAQNGLTSLNVTGCDSLHQIYCDGNGLTSLDVSTLGNLQMLRANENPFTSLDVTNNPKLRHLDVYNCNLPALDLTKNPELEILYCYETRDNEAVGNGSGVRRGTITNLDLSQNPKLKELRCSNLPLTDLNLSNNNALEILYVNSIDLSNSTFLTKKQNKNMPNLRRFSCYNSEVDELDLTSNTALNELICYKNNLERLNLINNVALETLICGDNQEGHDGRNALNPNGGNPITTLDVSNNINLKTLRCAKMNLTELNLTGLTKLKDLNYADQVRTIEAESNVIGFFDQNRQPYSKNLYYWRLDENWTGNEQSLSTHMARSDHDNISNFVLSRLNAQTWTNGTIFEGTREVPNNGPRRIVAETGDLSASSIVGKILVLDNVTETATDATGTVTYEYDVRLDPNATATDAHSPFTLNWHASPGVVTAVNDVPVGAQVTGVVYYNLAGVASLVPFEGVNIVVTNYDNGTTTVEKKINF